LQNADPHAELIRRLEDVSTELNRVSAEHPSGEAWSRKAHEGWSAHDVLGHMRASDDILIPRVYQILTRDNPPLPAFDERRWAEIAGYAEVPAEALFARIVIRWFELMQMLRHLPADAWQRTGVHEVSGALTLEQIVSHLVGHAEEHVAQIETLLSPAE
jgi:hypothetical protein